MGAGVRPSAGYAWPGNVDQLRIRAFERDKIVRVLTERGTTMRRAAAELGMSRATLYRKMSQNGIRMSRDRHQ